MLRPAVPFAHALDGVFHEPHVGVQTHRVREPGLMLAEEVARSAHLEVPERDLIAAAELGEVLEHPQPLFGLIRDAVGYDQVTVGAPVPASNASPDLVQLGEAEAIRPVHDQRIGVRHVQSVLDDRGADEDLGASPHEAGHGAVQRRDPHLAVRHVDGRFAHQPAHSFGSGVDGLDPVVQKEHLAAPVQLALAGLRDKVVAPRDEVGDDGHAVAGRGTDDRQITDARERQVEGPRYRRRRERKHVHRRAEPLQPLLLADPEALLLVDDHEPQILERDVP